MIDFAVLALVYGLVFFRTWRDRGADVLLVNTLLYGYLVLVLYVTLMPVIASLPFIFQHSYVPMNLVPFLDVLEGRGDFARQVVLNVIMTLPFGFLFPLTGNRRGGLLRTVWFCFLMSLGIELLQPLIHDYRSSDLTDVITNTVGGVPVGYIPPPGMSARENCEHQAGHMRPWKTKRACRTCPVRQALALPAEIGSHSSDLGPKPQGSSSERRAS